MTDTEQLKQDRAFVEDVRNRINAGEYARSTLCKPYIEALRIMARDWGWSSRDVGDFFGISRNSVIGTAHRAVPMIQFTAKPIKKWTQERREKQQRRKRRNSGNTLSTHHIRLQRARAGRVNGSIDREQAASRVVEPKNVGNFATAFTARFRGSGSATCCWAGCSDPPMAPGRPYCAQHHTGAGNLIAAKPLNFSRYRKD